MFLQLVKYIILAAIITFLIKSFPQFGLDNNYIIGAVIIGIIVFYFINTGSYDIDIPYFGDDEEYENMEAIAAEEQAGTQQIVPKSQCEKPVIAPMKYPFTSIHEDIIASGLNYDFNTPGYYLINNNQYSSNGISYDQVEDLICASKLNDLYNQHNHAKWTPYTHLGKDRGHMNHEKIYH